jgi:hypothetical protein
MLQCAIISLCFTIFNFYYFQRNSQIADQARRAAHAGVSRSDNGRTSDWADRCAGRRQMAMEEARDSDNSSRGIPKGMAREEWEKPAKRSKASSDE